MSAPCRFPLPPETTDMVVERDATCHGFWARWAVHDDTNPSLSLSPGWNGLTVWKWFAGGSPVQAYGAVPGVPNSWIGASVGHRGLGSTVIPSLSRRPWRLRQTRRRWQRATAGLLTGEPVPEFSGQLLTSASTQKPRSPVPNCPRWSWAIRLPCPEPCQSHGSYGAYPCRPARLPHRVGRSLPASPGTHC